MAKKETNETPDQTHPLYITDRDRLDAVLGHKGEPTNMHLTTVAMLFSRYADFPGSRDILEDLNKILGFWKLSRDELNAKTRAIWASGWKPGRDPMNDDSVGSGADVEGKDEQ